MKSIESNQISAISRFFSSGVVREMAYKGKSSLLTRLIHESLLLDSFSACDYIHNLFDVAFSILKKKAYRHEYVYKAALTHKILLGVHSLQTASMLTEVRVGECKADLVILNGTGTVYEIKSERDSLIRLERQIDAYKKVFAKVYVIAGENHIKDIFNIVSPDVGVLKLNNRHRISTLRDALDLPQRTCPSAIFDVIRISEAKQILYRYGLEVPHVPNMEMHAALRSRFINLAPRDTHEGMVHVLKKSRNLLPLANLVGNLPYSLQSAALSVPLRKADQERLLQAVNVRIFDALRWT